MLVWIIERRIIRNRTQKHQLRQGQFRHTPGKIPVSRRLNPVKTVGKINIIQIKLQNFFLVIPLFQLTRQKNFRYLSGIGLLVGQINIPGQLLGNGTSSLINRTLMLHQTVGRAKIRHIVHTLVGEKLLILRYNHCRYYRFRDIVIGQIIYILSRLQCLDYRTVGSVNNTGPGLFKILFGSLSHNTFRLMIIGQNRPSVLGVKPQSHRKQYQRKQQKQDAEYLKSASCFPFLIISLLFYGRLFSHTTPSFRHCSVMILSLLS